MRGRWHLLWRNARFAAAYGLIAVALCQFAYFNAVERLSVAVALLLEYLAPVIIVGYLWARGQAEPAHAGGGRARDRRAPPRPRRLRRGRLSLVGVLWGLVAAVGLVDYFLLSATSTRRPAAAGARVGRPGMGAAVLGGAGLVGALRMDASTADVVVGATRVPWWVPVAELAVVAAASRMPGHRRRAPPGRHGGVLPHADRGPLRGRLRLGAPRRAAGLINWAVGAHRGRGAGGAPRRGARRGRRRCAQTAPNRISRSPPSPKLIGLPRRGTSCGRLIVLRVRDRRGGACRRGGPFGGRVPTSLPRCHRPTSNPFQENLHHARDQARRRASPRSSARARRARSAATTRSPPSSTATGPRRCTSRCRGTTR